VPPGELTPNYRDDNKPVGVAESEGRGGNGGAGGRLDGGDVAGVVWLIRAAAVCFTA